MKRVLLAILLVVAPALFATPSQQLLLAGGSADFTASPTFFAPLITTLVPTTATGSATATFGATGAGTVGDWENVLKPVRTAEARFTGARRVENLLAKSEALNDAAWTKSNATIGTGVTDPLGGSTAFTVTATAANGAVYQQFSTTVGNARVASVWIKRRTGSGTVALVIAAGSAATITSAVSGSWQRVSIQENTTATSYFYLYMVTSGNAVDVWHPQLEEVGAQSNQNPSEYVSTGVLSSPYHGANVDGVKYFDTKNGNTVASNVVTEATGAAINTANGCSALTCDASGPLGLLIEKSQTNSTLGSQEDLTNWTTKTGVTITSENAISPSGPKTADLITEDGSTGAHAISQSFTSAASTYYVMSWFMKASGRSQMTVQHTDGVGGNATALCDVSAVTLTPSVAGTFSAGASGVITLPNGWFRCWMSYTNSTTTGANGFNAFVRNGITTSYAGCSCAAVWAWGFMLNPSLTANDVKPGSYALTTRSPESLQYSFASNASSTVGTAYAEVMALFTTAGANFPVISFSTDPSYPLYVASSAASTTINANDGTNSVQQTGLSNLSTAVRKVASSWTGSVLAVAGTGASAATGTFDGGMGSTAIGVGQPTTWNGTNLWPGWIRNLKLYTSAASAGQLATLVQ